MFIKFQKKFMILLLKKQKSCFLYAGKLPDNDNLHFLNTLISLIYLKAKNPNKYPQLI